MAYLSNRKIHHQAVPCPQQVSAHAEGFSCKSLPEKNMVFPSTISLFETLTIVREDSDDNIEIGLANATSPSRLWTPPYCW